MQTFLPYPDFTRCAEVLDDRRLGKQRVEALQILNALGRTSGGWVNHPAVKMWRGYELALARYALAMCDEWRRRGHRDGVRDQIVERYPELLSGEDVPRPPWLGDKAFHRSHRSNLVRKDAGFYGPLFPDESGDLPYAWPV
ncbi:MAG TPA: MSMEG_6728 family protein [Tepidiformaceae bacterium]|nr:MSMEG_6728 family protein [Tepidiformaceae bacterium]